MADAEWFEINGYAQTYMNAESATNDARAAASGTDDVIEIYQMTRTLVRTVRRTVTIQETDAKTPA